MLRRFQPVVAASKTTTNRFSFSMNVRSSTTTTFAASLLVAPSSSLLFSSSRFCSSSSSSSPTTATRTKNEKKVEEEEFGDNYDFSSTIEARNEERAQQEKEELKNQQQQQQFTHQENSAFFKLPGEERNRLTVMLYKEFFTQKEGVRDDSDIAKKAEIEGMYEARIELNWMIQWARDQKFPTHDKFVRAVQYAVLERVDLHKPLSFILGTQPFLGCDIKVESPLLIPRTETEEWVQWWCMQYMTKHANLHGAPLRILDLCCGTGCIGAGVLRQFPNVEVVGVDIEPLAVRTAADNYKAAATAAEAAFKKKREVAYKEKREEAEKALKERIRAYSMKMRSEHREDEEIKKMKKDEYDKYVRKQQDDEARFNQFEKDEEKRFATSPPRYTVLQSDMFRNLPAELEGTFDVILANPPYILPEEYKYQLPRSVRDWEAEVALVGDGRHTGKNLLYFKELRDEAVKWLSPEPVEKEYKGPRMMFELGLQAKIIQKLFAENKKWHRVDLHLDRFEEPRWCECFFKPKREIKL